MRKNPLNEIDKQQGVKETKIAQKIIDDILDGVKQISNKQIPLEVYKEYFEPLFLGKETLTKENTYLIDKYISYAGSIKASLDVVDEAGNIIATLPGIVSPTPKEFIENIPYDFEGIKNKHSMQSNTTKGRYANEAMIETVVDNLREELKNKDYVEKLEEFLVKEEDIQIEQQVYVVYDD